MGCKIMYIDDWDSSWLRVTRPMSRGRLLEPSWETGSRLMADANSTASRTLLVQNPAHRPATFIYLLKEVTREWKRIYREVTRTFDPAHLFFYTLAEWKRVELSFFFLCALPCSMTPFILSLIKFPIELHGPRDNPNWVIIKFNWWSFNILSLSWKECKGGIYWSLIGKSPNLTNWD